MTERLKALSGVFVYAVTGFAALILASWVSTQFIGRAVSQTRHGPMTMTVHKTPQAPPMPPPPVNDNVPQAPPAAQAPAAPNVPAMQPPGGVAGMGGAPSFADKGPVAVPLPKANPLADIIEDYTYDPKNKRDPFLPFAKPHSSNVQLGPVWPLQRFDLDQLKLVGIIWDVKTPKAMILDPSGKGYVVTVNERIGRNNGYIARIREGEIIIVESVEGADGKLSYQTKMMKLQQD